MSENETAIKLTSPIKNLYDFDRIEITTADPNYKYQTNVIYYIGDKYEDERGKIIIPFTHTVFNTVTRETKKYREHESFHTPRLVKSHINNILKDDVFGNLEYNVIGYVKTTLKGHRTCVPSKRSPAVKVNVRRMF